MRYLCGVSTSPRRFELQQCLGRGSFGEVYAASMRSAGGLQTTVALKLLRSDIDLQSQAVRRLADEGRLLARLHHPAILRVYDLIRLNGRLCLITELIEGEDLAELIGARDPLPVRPLLQVMSQVASGLAAALETRGPDGPLRLVHRDVKPSNIRIDRHGQGKLLDFGVARFDASDREVRTASDLIVGSIPYMAPERFVQREVDPSSDIFSLGCTLYEGITDQRFYGNSRAAAITAMALKPERYHAHLAQQLRALQVPTAVGDMLATMLAPDPADRPTAAVCARRLEELAEAIEGPTLRMWCRDRVWPTPKPMDGSLDGQVLLEGELLPETPLSAPGLPQLNLHAKATLQPGSTAEVPTPPVLPTPAVLPTLVPGPASNEEGLATKLLASGGMERPPAIPQRDIKTVLRPPSDPPARISAPPTDPQISPGSWVVVLTFVGFSAALGLAIFVGFAMFTALMTL